MIIREIPYEFIRQRVQLGWNDVKYGLEQQLIKPKVAIESATEELSNIGAAASKDVLELADLTENESVADLVEHLAKSERPPLPEDVKAKWLYLVLAWLFENRNSLVDPLGMVELVYSDFDYPREIASFVRSMPMVGPDLRNREQNEARLFDRWKAYLDEAGKRFSRTFERRQPMA